MNSKKTMLYSLSLLLVCILIFAFVISNVSQTETKQNNAEVSKIIDSGIKAINDKLIENHKFEAFYDKCYSFIYNGEKAYYITGKVTGGNHIPTINLLVNDEGELIKELDTYNNVYIKDSIFIELNNDRLLDYIVIVSGPNGEVPNHCYIYFQNKKGEFIFQEKYSKVFNNTESEVLLTLDDIIIVLKENSVY